MIDINAPIEYIERTKYYYQKLGYGEPYAWAHYDKTPFCVLSKPLKECSVTLVTTAAPYQYDKGEQGPGAAYNAAAKFFSVYSDNTAVLPDLRISHIAIDRDHTTAEDLGSYFPLKALKQVADEQLIGEVGSRFFGLPTNRSQRKTISIDCEELKSLCKEDSLDIVLLVPNCPVCHQSVSLAARALEECGIVTVVMGCAKDIVERVGVPRFLFSDFPLGNSAGRPHDNQCQIDTIKMALELAANAKQANTTAQSPYQWDKSIQWKEDYANPDKLTSTEIEQKRKAFDDAKKLAKQSQSNNNQAYAKRSNPSSLFR